MNVGLAAPTAVFLALVGVGGIGAGLWERRRARRQAAWPRVRGTVTATNVHTDGDPVASNVGLSYRYQVAGAEYEGYAPAFQATSVAGDLAKAEAMAALHPPGTTVWVYHNPKAPAHSVLEPPEPARAGVAAIVAGATAVAAGAYALVAG